MNESSAAPPQRWQGLEFTLVVIMLGILAVLVTFVLWVPESKATTPQPLPKEATAEQILKHQAEVLAQQKLSQDYRKDILSLLLTAFGAWVGAGAAYFFGRESLRDANALLRSREESGKERLGHAKVSDLPLRQLDPLVPETDLLQPVVERLKGDNALWFVAIRNADGSLKDVIHKEGVWRYVIDNADLTGKTIADLRTFLDANESLRTSFLGIFVPVKPDMSAAQAHDLLSQKNVYLGVVLNEAEQPAGFFDTADVRRFLLK